jgi:hypothetical protein
MPVISVSGSLLSPRSVNSLVPPELTGAPINAVRQWRYEPTLRYGEPVEVITTVTANFPLEQQARTGAANQRFCSDAQIISSSLRAKMCPLA